MAEFENFSQVISDARAQNGAEQNSLGTSWELLSTNLSELEKANGRIKDADYAKEMTNLGKSQILNQSAAMTLGQQNRIEGVHSTFSVGTAHHSTFEKQALGANGLVSPPSLHLSLRSQPAVGLQTATHHAPVPAQGEDRSPLKKSSSTANPAAPAYRENFANLSTKYGVRLKRITASL